MDADRLSATIVYLDADDEITTAAARIRTAAAGRIALVLPFGSRVATSRINFRLLAREAQVDGRRLDIVAPDPSARALAASAGLAVFASVGEYETAMDGDRDGAGAPQGSPVAPPQTQAAAPPAVAEETPAAAPRLRSRAQVPASDPARQAELDEIVSRSRQPPVARPGRRGPGAGAIVALLVVVLAVVAGAAVAAFVLPSAEVVVTPRIEPVGPLSVTVTADPQSTAVDPAAGVIPAQTLEVPVEVSGEFQATGKRIEETKASGGVRWTNCDPTAAYRIPRGSVVKTADGIGFLTAEEVFLPVAGVSGTPPNLSVQCTSSEVAVTAALAGESGNVPARAIKVVPARYNRTFITVSNLAPTTGGTRTEFARVNQADVDAALAALRLELDAQFAIELQDPQLAPAGATVFAETAVAGEPAPNPDPATLVGQEAATFTLGLTATGSVLAVDATPVEAIARSRLTALISPGWELVEGSIRVEVGEATVTQGLIDFPVMGSARQLRPLDAAALEREVLGLPGEAARAALASYGEVSITFWPGWVTSVPTLDQRVTLTLAPPVDPTPDPTPRVTPAPPATPAPDASPDASADAAGSEPVPSG